MPLRPFKLCFQKPGIICYLLYLGPTLWRRLPRGTRSASTLSQFKKLVRQMDLSNLISNECGPDCFLCILGDPGENFSAPSGASIRSAVWNWFVKSLSPWARSFLSYFCSSNFFPPVLIFVFGPTICPWVSEDVFSAFRRDKEYFFLIE